jgi:DNA (cytosine-5)-methyltransferase 1
MKFIDLFCGIGGFHQALASLGHECVFASDIDASCRRVYKDNYGIEPVGDITKHVDDVPPHDIMCGGFPCQPFSKAGFQRGFEDENRGNLFFVMCEIIDRHKPKYLLLENVRNLASHDNGDTWEVIKRSLRELGYSTYDDPTILNVLHFDVPQNRERVVIMAVRGGELPPLPEFSRNPRRTAQVQVSSVVETHPPSLPRKLEVVQEVWDRFLGLVNDPPRFPIWTDWWDSGDDPDPRYVRWITQNREFWEDNKATLQPWLAWAREKPEWVGAVRKMEWQTGMPGTTLNDFLWTPRPSGIRVKKCDYIPTLVAMAQIPVYGPQRRKLNPKELLRLQSFPDDFKYEEKKIFKQVGNAVNCKMIRWCMEFLASG